MNWVTLGTQFSGGLGSVRLMVGLDDLESLFKPKRFCELVLEKTY